MRRRYLRIAATSRVIVQASFCDRLLDHSHSEAIKPDKLSALWARAVLKLLPHPLRVNGRLVLVADGIKAAKRGKNNLEFVNTRTVEIDR